MPSTLSVLNCNHHHKWSNTWLKIKVRDWWKNVHNTRTKRAQYCRLQVIMKKNMPLVYADMGLVSNKNGTVFIQKQWSQARRVIQQARGLRKLWWRIFRKNCKRKKPRGLPKKTVVADFPKKLQNTNRLQKSSKGGTVSVFLAVHYEKTNVFLQGQRERKIGTQIHSNKDLRRDISWGFLIYHSGGEKKTETLCIRKVCLVKSSGH